MSDSKPPRFKRTRTNPPKSKQPDKPKPPDEVEQAINNIKDDIQQANDNIKDNIEQKIWKIWENAEVENIFKEQRKFAREIARLFPEFEKWLRETYPLFFKKIMDRLPYKWMNGKRGDKKIKKRLENPKDVLWKVFKLLNRLLYYHTINDGDRAVELAKRVGAGTLERIQIETLKDEQGRTIKKEVSVKYDYAFLDPELNFKEMETKLGDGFSHSEVKRLMEECARVEVHFLQKFGKASEHGRMLYAIGYLIPTGWGGFRVEPFIHETKGYIRALEKFTLPRQREREKKGGSRNS